MMLKAALLKAALIALLATPAHALQFGVASSSSARRFRASSPVASEEAPSLLRSYNAAEEKALRKARMGFSGYPPGPYFQKSDEDAYAAVRSDHAILDSWSDDELKETINSLTATPQELLIYSPIGPFIVLSTLAILRDGMDLGTWGKLEPIEALSFMKIHF
jgi:hypothetical protein